MRACSAPISDEMFANVSLPHPQVEHGTYVLTDRYESGLSALVVDDLTATAALIFWHSRSQRIVPTRVADLVLNCTCEGASSILCILTCARDRRGTTCRPQQ